jgi:TRAP-type mannitol/chloroaromatic compound transport system substrate-binding protein
VKRRQLIRQMTIGTATAGTLTACSQQTQFFGAQTQLVSQPRVEWRMATSWPESLDIVFGTAQLICDRVGELTGGNFSITAFPAGGIAPPLEILDTIQAGTAECGHTAGYYYTSKNPALAFATSVPFGLSPNQHLAWMYGAGGLDLLREVYADYNAINFPAGSTGNQMGGWFKRKVPTLADLNGLKIRMPGLGGEVMKRLGAAAQTLPPEEISPALERNDIEAAEWVGPYEDEKLGLNKVAPFYYYPGWHEPGTTYELIVNRSSWDRLPVEYQQALQVSAAEAHMMMLSRYDAANREALERLLSSGTELTAYTSEVINGAQAAALELYEGFASEDASFRRIYDNWKDFRQSIYQWNRVNEQSLAEFISAES